MSIANAGKVRAINWFFNRKMPHVPKRGKLNPRVNKRTKLNKLQHNISAHPIVAKTPNKQPPKQKGEFVAKKRLKKVDPSLYRMN